MIKIIILYYTFISGISDKTPKKRKRFQYNAVTVCYLFLISALISAIVIDAMVIDAMGVHSNGFHNINRNRNRNSAIALLVVFSILLVLVLIMQIDKAIAGFIIVSRKVKVSNEAKESNEVRELSFAEKAQSLFDPIGVFNKL